MVIGLDPVEFEAALPPDSATGLKVTSVWRCLHAALDLWTGMTGSTD